jgi:hypothetical protein
MTSAPDARATVLFLMLNPSYVRSFESVLRGLAERGIETTVMFEHRKGASDEAGLEHLRGLCAELGLLYHGPPRASPRALRARVRTAFEAVQDYLWYFEPPLASASRLRARVVPRVPAGIEGATAGALARAVRARARIAGLSRKGAAALGPDPRVRDELARRRPSLLMVSPMVHLRSRQNDWVLAARELGIETMLCVSGWDHLTSKGRIHVTPARIAVWNDAQREQAVALHGADPGAIAVVGAWPYDHWSAWRPSRSRDELSAELALPAGRPLILYACSSRFIAPEEAPAVADWVAALRACGDARATSANVIVRPHPHNTGWSDVPLRGLPGVAVFPRQGADPVDDASRADYFDSMALADAVVGVNTSALIEAPVLDRPALAFPPPRFSATQQDLPHFRELDPRGEAIAVAGSMDEHLRQLGRALVDPAAGAEARLRFVARFVRAGAADPPPTERLLAFVDDLVAGSPANRPPSGVPGAPTMMA